jgi:hypothetical protein
MEGVSCVKRFCRLYYFIVFAYSKKLMHLAFSPTFFCMSIDPFRSRTRFPGSLFLSFLASRKVACLQKSARPPIVTSIHSLPSAQHGQKKHHHKFFMDIHSTLHNIPTCPFVRSLLSSSPFASRDHWPDGSSMYTSQNIKQTI